MTWRAAEWLGAFVPLGLSRDEHTWRPLGAGVLVIDAPLIWLVSTRSLLDAAGERTVAAFVSQSGDGTALDLTTGRRGTPLDWLRHEALDLAVCLCPISPEWSIKAFPEARCLAPGELEPGLPLQVVACAWGTELGARPAPLLLAGQVARCEASRLVATTPLPPGNLGAPLVAAGPGGASLAGIVTGQAAVPDPRGPWPALSLSLAVPIAEAWGLIRSEAGKAQRRVALERSGSAEAPDASAT